MRFNREELHDQAASLTAQGVYVGTSSWKYPGWCGMLYASSRWIGIPPHGGGCKNVNY